MAEVAAASSIAGLISLGLEACGGLKEYYNRWKAYDNDCNDIWRNLHSVENSLEVLHSVINSSDLVLRPSFQAVLDKIEECRSGIEELNNAKNSCFSKPPSVMARQFSRALYPFRKSKITSPKSTLDGIQSNLKLALQIAECDQGNYMLSVLNSQHEQGMGQLSTISVHIENQSAVNRMTLQRVEDLTDLINQKFDDMRIDRRQSPSLDRLPLVPSNDVTDFPRRKRRSKPHSKSTEPVNLAEICKSACTCQRKENFFTETKWKYSFIQFLSQDWIEHHPSCPDFCSAKKHRKNEVRIIIPFIRRATGEAMSLDISIGLGGTSLRRALACRRILDEDSPVLRLFYPFGDPLENLDEAKYWMITRKCLNDMLLNGEVFPNDVNMRGETIVHIVLEELMYQLRMNFPTADEMIAQSGLLLLSDLAAASFPLNEKNASDRLPLDLVFQLTFLNLPVPVKAFTLVIGPLTGLGASVAGSTWRHGWDPTAVSACATLADDLELSQFHIALLSKSLPAIHDVLRDNPRCVDEILPYNQSGAHVASDWPEGLIVLIDAGVDISRRDSLDRSPLYYALASQHLECAMLLLRADCGIARANVVLQKAFEFDEACSQPFGSGSMSMTVIEAIADRRKRLRELALNRLPKDILHSLNLHENVLPDADACEIQLELQVHDVEIPIDLQTAADQCDEIVWGCVESRWMTTDIAQYIWNSGFYNVYLEAEGSYRKPVLSLPLRFCLAKQEDVLRAAAVTNWLYSKVGLAKEDFVKRDWSCAIASALGDNLGWNLKTCYSCMTGNSQMMCRSQIVGDSQMIEDSHTRIPAPKDDTQDASDFLADIFRDISNPTHAECRCACSSDGCVALDRFCRAAFRTFSGGVQSNVCENVQCIELLAEVLGCSSAHLIALTPRIIRAILFQWLEMRHTCCEWDVTSSQFDFVDLEWAHEIREERAEAIERFESLLSELIEEYFASEMDLVSWLKGPLIERVKELKHKEREPDQEYTQGVFAATGVKLETEGIS